MMRPSLLCVIGSVACTNLAILTGADGWAGAALGLLVAALFVNTWTGE